MKSCKGGRKMSRKNIYLEEKNVTASSKGRGFRTIAEFTKKGIAVVLIGSFLLTGGVYSKKSEGKAQVLNYQKLTLSVGKTKQLKWNGAKKKVTWSSKDKKVATVTQKGLVKAKKKGATQIIAKLGKKKAVCKVTVKEVTMPAKPTETPISDWTKDKVSGTQEAYEKYFDVKITQYTKIQEGTTLGSFDTIQYFSTVVGAEREAYVYLPPNYDKNKKYPVLYMLHGIGCDKGQWRSMSMNNIVSNMICQKEVPPFIAVLPSIIPKDGLSKDTFSQENIEAFSLFEQEFIKDLEPYILENYSASSDRKDTGVCGLSMGGMEALHLGFSLKDHFNYIGSFSAAPTLDQSLLTLKGWKTTPELVLLCSGTADGTIGQNPYNYHMALTKNNVDHIWYQFPKGGHDERVWKNGLVNFLKRSFQ